MILAFYRVDNNLGYGRHTFDDMSNDEIIEKLSKLDECDLRIYKADCYGYGAVPAPNLADFEYDFNNEELDGGWWCIVINNK